MLAERVAARGVRARRSAVPLVVFLVISAVAALAPSILTPTRADGWPYYLGSPYQTMGVDPIGGRLYSSVGDTVRVHDANGVFEQAIPGIWGASALDFVGGDLWVAETTTGSFARIDIATNTVKQVITTGTTVRGPFVVLQGKIVFGGGVVNPADPEDRIMVYDLASGAMGSTASPVGRFLDIRRLGPSPDQFFVGTETNDTSTIAAVMQVAGLGATVVRSGPFGGNTGIAIDGHGDRFWAPTDQRWMSEASTSTLRPDGPRYEVGAFPYAMAASSARGGLLAASRSDGRLYVFRDGQPRAINELSGSAATKLAFSADGLRLFGAGPDGYPFSVSLTPTMAVPAQPAVVAGVPSRLKVTGSGLGGTTAFAVNGAPARFTVVSAGELAVDLPAGVTAGPAALVALTPFGFATASVAVVPSSGASIAGVVRRGATPATGVSLTLADGGGTLPALGTTSGAGGSYAFNGLTPGTRYELRSHDPTGTTPDQVIGPLVASANATVTRDIDLLAPAAPPGAELRRTPLPVAPLDLQVDPTSGRLFATYGDQVEVFDATGARLATVTGIGGAGAMTFSNGSLYVDQARLGRVTRIDTASLAVTGSWSAQQQIRDTIAFAAGRIWLSTMDEHLLNIDPTTGAIGAPPPNYWGGVLRSVRDSPNLLLVAGSYGAGFSVMDAATLASVGDQVGVTPFLGAAGPGKVWTGDGVQRNLSDLTPDGITYALPSSIYYGLGLAYSPGHGGTLAFRSSIARVGTPALSDRLPEADPGHVALSNDGNRAFFVTAGNDLVTWDLVPHVTAVTPSASAQAGAQLSLAGSGLGLVSSAAVDGTTATFAGATVDGVTVTMPSLAPGFHAVTVTTPYGTSKPIWFEYTGPLPQGSGFHAVVPTRLLDSRTSTGGWAGPLVAGADRPLTVTGAGIPATAKAVVLNVTATGSSAGSFLTAYPAGSARPPTSNLNFAAGQTIANLVTVPVGADGKVAFSTAVGRTDVIADLVGYYDDGVTIGDRFHATDPTRLLDSRTSTGGWNGPLPAGPSAARPLHVAGANGIPADATAVAMNVTVTGASANSYLRVWPSGVATPITSNINFAAGQTTANLVLTQIGAGGDVRVQNAVGSVDVVADVVGYFTAGPGGSLFHAVGPNRILDDRTGTGLTGPWSAGQSRAFTATTTTGVPASATAIVTTVTVTNGTAGTFLTAFPTGGAVPTASTINAPPGTTIANHAITKLGVGGQLSIFNAAGSIDVIADTVGYFAPEGAP